ncbi:hypothetical protein IH992_00940 [Candidatus Poribacteria bacterium]|nr:hypothetical protein [Candidatus Poribacteria bacterium]
MKTNEGQRNPSDGRADPSGGRKNLANLAHLTDCATPTQTVDYACNANCQFARPPERMDEWR